ncbi:MAG: sodium:solute symporter family protein [Bryobacterales bacterium]|nr:sodium:solute symporter family protein [Bryobacterales bacterium]MDE0620837.1 sodium:solute symporter family protein [Bryobacterales bacterium]
MLPILAAYCLLLVLVGAFASRSVRRAEDFFVAGRSLPPTLIFSTFLAANLGAGSTVGAAEFGYTSGLPAWWWVGSAGIGSVVLAFLVGPRLHRVAKARGLYTVGDYLELRYGRTTRLVVAAILLVGAPAILAGQIIAAGLVLQAAVGLPKSLGTALAGTLATVYFAMGGLRSASWVNSLQVAVKAVGFLVAVPWMIAASGGWTEVAAAAADDTALSLGGAGFGDTAQLVLLLAPAFVVSPGLVQKLFGARDEHAVRVGVGLQAAALLAYAVLPVLLGMAARVHFPELADPDSALVKLFTEVAPLWLGALMLAAILSAEVSSADAVLFMIATSLSRDVLEPLSRGKLSDRERLALARRSALGAGALSILLANWFQSILSALSFFYSLLTLTLFVPLVAGLFWRRPGQSVALAAIAASLGAAGLAVLSGGAAEGWLPPIPVGILAGAIVYVAHARIGQPAGGL